MALSKNEINFRKYLQRYHPKTYAEYVNIVDHKKNFQDELFQKENAKLEAQKKQKNKPTAHR